MRPLNLDIAWALTLCEFAASNNTPMGAAEMGAAPKGDPTAVATRIIGTPFEDSAPYLRADPTPSLDSFS